MQKQDFLKGRGAQSNPSNKFHSLAKSQNICSYTGENKRKTKFLKTYAKTILNKVNSPDVPYGYGLNPYQGCEHGCVYCYARNTHQYWGYSAGLDFESVILVKENAPALLRTKLQSKSWAGSPIMISGNTDCNQPIEKKLELTRQILEICYQYRNPIALITKNSLMLRDLDILQRLCAKKLVSVAVSLNTFDDHFRQKLEPRASSVNTRLDLIKQLINHDIPTKVLMAPVIPSLNDQEIPSFVKRMASLGVLDVNYLLVRLNGEVALVFEDWLRKVYPDRANKVLHHIKSVHGGKLNDSRFVTRMRGEGHYAKMIRDQFRIAKQRHFKNIIPFKFDLSLFHLKRNPQQRLF